MSRVGLVDACEHESDPLYVKADFREDCVLEWIAVEGGLPSRTEADDSLNHPRLGVAREEHHPTAAVAVARRSSVAPARAECRERHVLSEVFRLLLDAFLVRHYRKTNSSNLVAARVVLRHPHADDDSHLIARQMGDDVVELPVNARRMNVVAEGDGAFQLNKCNIRTVVTSPVQVEWMANNASDVEELGELVIARRRRVIAQTLANNDFCIRLVDVGEAMSRRKHYELADESCYGKREVKSYKNLAIRGSFSDL